MDAQTLHLLRPEDRAFHDEAVAWLSDHVPAFMKRHTGAERDETAHFGMLQAWQKEMAAGRWVAVDWPEEWGGRGANGVQKILLDLALVEHKAPVSIWRQATDNVGPPLLRYGSRGQQQALLPGIVRGDSVWCQGFSEPDSGSDLASLRTRAEPCEGGYRVNGQKIWTSNAYFATHMWLLARTNRDVPKHQGISAFVLDMKTPGITVRPIRELTGAKVGQQRYNQQFNQVFFDEVFIPEANRIGPENEGWKVCKATLVVERAARYNLGLAANSARALHRVLSEPVLSDQRERLGADYGDRIVDMDMLIDGLEEIYRINLQAVLAGRSTGGESSVLKLLSSEARQSAAELAFELGGPYAQFMNGSPDAIKRGNAAFELVRSRSCTIGGGTSEIQRNWIAQHLLGLPKG